MISSKSQKIDSIIERVGQIIFDTIYSQEKTLLETQLNSARKNNDTDSTDFLQYEIGYKQKEIDSLTSAINGTDTVIKYGVIATCSYTLTKNNKTKTTNPIYYIINNQAGIMNSDMIDKFIRDSIN